LMIALALSSAAVFVNAIFELRSFGPERINVETWRSFGFLVFAGLYALLAFFPRRMPGVWELVVFHKVSVSVFLSFFGGASPDASVAGTTDTIILVDSILAGTTLVSYVLAQGWRSWLNPTSAK
ncbi:MAG: hypothetical protein K8R18_17630, partial [Parvibaculum sp.]|uniref:hypothetical protein n=1 Tax=Parvibaculum sp. TaxID=2024848 RepID=UPI0025E6F6D4